MSARGTQVQARPKQNSAKPNLCPRPCNLIPISVPGPSITQTILHPKKDVFLLKVAKIGPNGDRRCKMELELVTPKGPDKSSPFRYDTRDTQCEPDPPPCCCSRQKKKKK